MAMIQQWRIQVASALVLATGPVPAQADWQLRMPPAGPGALDGRGVCALAAAVPRALATRESV